MATRKEAASRFELKLERKRSNLASIDALIAKTRSTQAALSFLQTRRYSASRALAISALNRKIDYALDRRRKTARSLTVAEETHSRQVRIREAIDRAKRSIGTAKQTRERSFNPGVYVMEPYFTTFTDGDGVLSDIDTGFALRKTLTHESQYQDISAYKQAGLPVPWLPYSRAVTLDRTPTGSVVLDAPDIPVGLKDSVGSGNLISLGFPQYAHLLSQFPGEDQISSDLQTQLAVRSMTQPFPGRFDVPTQLMELHESLGFVQDMYQQAKAWWDTTQDLRKEVGTFAKDVSALSMIASSGWLSYQLAVKPLVAAAEDLRNLSLTSPETVNVTGAGRPRAKQAWSQTVLLGSSEGTGVIYAEMRVETRKRFGFTYEVENPVVFAANQLHALEPLSAVWEGMPLSFVIDYFVKVGEYVRGVERRAALQRSGRITAGWLVTTREFKLTLRPTGGKSGRFGINTPEVFKQTLYSRQLQNNFPNVGSLRLTYPDRNTEGGRTQLLTLAALLTQLVLFKRAIPSELKKSPRFTSRSDFLEHWLAKPFGFSRFSPRVKSDLRRALAQRERGLVPQKSPPSRGGGG